MTGAEAAPALSLPRVESAVKSASNSVGRCGGVVLQAAAASNQSLLFAAAAGGLENGAEKISLRDAFEVASVTKIVTATAVMQLADEGLLHLDQDLDEVAEGQVSVLIQEKVPKWPLNRLRGVTITQLLQHTSRSPRKLSRGSAETTRETIGRPRLIGYAFKLEVTMQDKMDATAERERERERERRYDDSFPR